MGIDDGAFESFKGRVWLIGVVVKGNAEIEAVLSGKVTIDGRDATRKIISFAEKRKDASAIMLNGVTLGGFNVVDINEVYEKTRIPVITIMRRKPDMEQMFKALAHSKNRKGKKALLEHAGNVYKAAKCYYQVAGTTPQVARLLIKNSTLHASIPEPVRLAHIIASGVSRGQSHGKA